MLQSKNKKLKKSAIYFTWYIPSTTPSFTYIILSDLKTISNFSIALIVGVISGTYSSIYIVCNTLLSLKVTSEDLMIRKTEVLDDGMP